MSNRPCRRLVRRTPSSGVQKSTSRSALPRVHSGAQAPCRDRYEQAPQNDVGPIGSGRRRRGILATSRCLFQHFPVVARASASRARQAMGLASCARRFATEPGHGRSLRRRRSLRDGQLKIAANLLWTRSSAIRQFLPDARLGWNSMRVRGVCPSGLNYRNRSSLGLHDRHLECRLRSDSDQTR